MKKQLYFAVLGLSFPIASLAQIVVGDVAIIGRVNNTAPDTFAFVALNTIANGSTLYFTDNGWTGSTFRGAGTDGDGNENLIRWTASASISAGTVIRSDSSSANYTWTTSGSIPGATGSFANLAISQSGDQIYAFTGPTSNPLNSPTTHLFVLDDTNGFEASTSSSTGSQPSGARGLTLSAAVAGGIRVSDLTGSRTASEWLTYFETSANWGSATDLTGLPASITVSAVPEPTEYAAFGGLSLLGFALWRRKTVRKG